MNLLSRIASTLRDRLTARRHQTHDIRLRVANLTRNTVLATRMELADSSPKRNKGLLGRSHLAPGEGLWILPCEAIHTFGMKFPIDLVYLDGKNRIKKLCREVPPWRLSVCLSARSVLELPSGAIRETKTRPGDTLEFSSASASGDSADAARS
ncbi:MAG: DUF192 domain-containing protein [Terracidiphilus sp.]|jgi:uncharacterized membrane protein (UPF0127 family)